MEFKCPHCENHNLVDFDDMSLRSLCSQKFAAAFYEVNK